MNSNNCLTYDEKWEKNLNLVVEYFKANGRLPLTSDRDNGGLWLMNQRQALKKGKLSVKRKSILDKKLVGWDNVYLGRTNEDAWNKYLVKVLYYYELNNRLPVQRDAKNGGLWLMNQRLAIRNNKMREDRKKRLDILLPDWNKEGNGKTNDQLWMNYLEVVKNYVNLNGVFPSSTDKENGGIWLSNQRQIYREGRLREVRKQILDEVLPNWSLDGKSNYRDDIWMNNLEKVRLYYNIYNEFPVFTDKENGGIWLNNQRRLFKSGNLKETRRELLDSLLPNWSCSRDNNKDEAWIANLEKVINYYNNHGSFPHSTDKENGGLWLVNQRLLLKYNKLREDRKEVLDNRLPNWNCFKKKVVCIETSENYEIVKNGKTRIRKDN